ncbi:hepatic and glial cell adhesion molecule-like isoform X2 [Syngnathoides biaculeatus]|uniref:hepatic and glial cell adhesion molecule-like isoform X2 n=1 Tax=Syngnathoides biaculeatus TaxID=300417 RepID=UPI002ADD7F50|nr:hepatic and glial cell adhesion molecule-like isoform X2 [Syngnathoides biaculeatus]
MVLQQALLYLIFTSRLVSGQVLKYALRGQEIHFFPPKIEKPDVIVWVHDGSNVVEFNSMTEETYVLPPYQNRVILDHNTAELTIRGAAYEDSGNYDLKFKINDEHQRIKFRVDVIDKVSKPNISCEMINASKATLVCSAECNCPHLLKFKWHSQGKKWAGPNLTITLINEDDDQVYQCGVSNPLTNETSTFTAKDCFQEQTPAPVIYRWDDMGGFWVSFITIFMIGFTTGYMVRRKFRCSECFQAIKKRRHKRKQNKRTGETAAFEKSPPLLDQGQQSKAKPRQEHYHPPPPKKKATSCHSDTGTQKLSHPLPLILNNY